jgi:beta-glucanase (GH16 family)
MTHGRTEFLPAVLVLTGCVSGERPATRTTEAGADTFPGWELVWTDEFGGTLIDRRSWTPEVMPDPQTEELQYYTARLDAESGANAWLENGSLVIEVF